MRKDTWKASVASLVGVTSEDRHLPFLLLPLLAMEEITPSVYYTCLLSGLTIWYWTASFPGKSISPTLSIP